MLGPVSNLFGAPASRMSAALVCPFPSLLTYSLEYISDKDHQRNSVLAAESPLSKTTLSSSQSLSRTLLGSVKDRTQSPKQAVVLVLGQCWLLPKSVKSDLMKIESAVQPKWLPKLPSKGDYIPWKRTLKTFG